MSRLPSRRRFVALLRGINVGRAKRVSMSDLRDVVESLGFSDVRTVLNSGNVVLSGGRTSPATVARAIEQAVADRAGFHSRVTVLTAADFAAVVAENPLGEVASDPARHLVAFLRDPANARPALAPLLREQWTPDALALGTSAAYLWCANGLLESRLAEAVGRLLGDGVTTRNWSTVAKVHALL